MQNDQEQTAAENCIIKACVINTLIGTWKMFKTSNAQNQAEADQTKQQENSSNQHEELHSAYTLMSRQDESISTIK